MLISGTYHEWTADRKYRKVGGRQRVGKARALACNGWTRNDSVKTLRHVLVLVRMSPPPGSSRLSSIVHKITTSLRIYFVIDTVVRKCRELCYTIYGVYYTGTDFWEGATEPLEGRNGAACRAATLPLPRCLAICLTPLPSPRQTHQCRRQSTEEPTPSSTTSRLFHPP